MKNTSFTVLMGCVQWWKASSELPVVQCQLFGRTHWHHREVFMEKSAIAAVWAHLYYMFSGGTCVYCLLWLLLDVRTIGTCLFILLPRACYGVLRFIMESGARGCEVIVSGKLRGQRAKSMKFVDGLMIHAGNPTREYIQSAVTHVLLRQGQ